ncbi:unnamed protein product [Dibothriocephalus latus]|uniref:Uncharacterized protein n=1 Tax=Dibothriocephalus latus TaxID=60516 RepID=A0A3P6PL78_DIBLA|nr:unnamed protein product [Dibothriocephalus latus]
MEWANCVSSIRTFLAILFLILALALGRWPCGTILGTCLSSSEEEIYRSVGVLLATSLALNVVAFEVALVGCITEGTWARISVKVPASLGGIETLARVANYYAHEDQNYSPILAVISMCFTSI